MGRITFEWDAKKNTSNEKKHGVSFAEAKSVFTDQYARLIAGLDHSDDEDPFILLGISIQSRLLIVCHCLRTDDSVRIISARKADKDERNIYEDYRHA